MTAAPEIPGAQRIQSEDALIQRYLAPLAAGFPGAFALTDDGALLTPPTGEDLVLTTDAVAAGVHFLPGDAPEDVAWKALAVNVSDLIAKGARPMAYLMALAFPEAPQTAWLEKFASGLAAAQSRFGLALAGGDTDRRPGPLAITITAIGTVPAGRMVLRSTARAGDRIFVTGTLGDAALGLKLRTAPAFATAWGIDDDASALLVARYLRPEPPLSLRGALLDFASAAIDISDGLAKDLGRLADASALSARIAGARIPLSGPVNAALSSKPDLFADVVTGGDDYEVLASVPADHAEAFRAGARRADIEVTEIGAFEAGRGVAIMARNGQSLRFERPGWDHF